MTETQQSSFLLTTMVYARLWRGFKFQVSSFKFQVSSLLRLPKELPVVTMNTACK